MALLYSGRLAFVITKFQLQYRVIGIDGTVFGQSDPIVKLTNKRNILNELNGWLENDKTSGWERMTQMSDDWKQFCDEILYKNCRTRPASIQLIVIRN